MRKPLLTILILLLSSFLFGQEDLIIFKKGNRSIAKFWKGEFISFQLENKNWEKGELMRIKNDSFYIRPRVIRYSFMRIDTIYFPIKGFMISNIYAMPKRGVLVDFVGGKFQISRTGGHQHFYWVKSGLIFKIGGAGYAALSLLNEGSSEQKRRGVIIGAGIFAAGVVLKKIYKLTIRIRGRHQVEVVKLSPG